MRTLGTDKDAYVDAGWTFANFGDATSLYVRYQSAVLGGNHRETLVGFDTTSIFDDADVLEILTATLRIPVQDSEDDQDLECHAIDEEAWTEDGVDWNNKPDRGSLQDTADSTERPHAWNVLDEVQAGLDDGAQARVGFLLSQPLGIEAHLHEYDSREQSGSNRPELVLETREQRRADLDSQVFAGKSGTADLDGFVEVKFFSAVYKHGRDVQLASADPGGNADIEDLAWDPARQVMWGLDQVANQDNELALPQYDRDGQRVATYVDPNNGDIADLSRGLASDGDNLYLLERASDLDNQPWLHTFSIDDDNQQLVLESSKRFGREDIPLSLAYDQDEDTFWVAWVDDLEEWDSAFTNLLTTHEDVYVKRVAAPMGEDVLVGLEGPSMDVLTVDKATGEITERFSPDESDDFYHFIGVWGDDWLDRLFYGIDDDEVALLTSTTIDSQLLVPTPGEAGIDAAVQPSSVPRQVHLSSKVATGSEADLATTATPRVDGWADLAGLVQPGGLEGVADLTAIAEVAAVPISDDSRGRAVGQVAPTVVVDETDMADVSGEVGTAITLDPDGEARDLRRVVHLLDGKERYPRARADTATTLYRGDAVLYAQSGDELEVGDVLEWQDKRWKIVGLLGWEAVGDSRLYQEVGLRRLATVHEARATGTVS